MSRFLSLALCALFVGSVCSTEASAADAKAGKAVFEGTCKTCHIPGLMGSPKLGDKAAWKPRIAQGEALLVKHATEGFKGKAGVMPPKGGKASLSNADIANSVAYIIEQSK